MDLVAWLREQIAEDERQCEFNDEPESWCDRAEGVHYDSRRVLAEVTAKRKLLQLHSPAGITSDPPYKWACSVCHRRDGWWAGEYPCTTVRLLVAPFASRAGFDPSWLD